VETPPDEISAAVSEVVAAYGGVRPVEQSEGFAPAVAPGMVIGQIGAHHTEAPAPPTSLPWDVHTQFTTPDMLGLPNRRSDASMVRPGRAIPEPAIAQLDAHLPTLAYDFSWLVQSLGVTRPSKSQVSMMAAELDEALAAFRTRPLHGGTLHVVAADALVLKVRENGRVVGCTR
jgi:hypothetical protein